MLGKLGKGNWIEGEAEILVEDVVKDPNPKPTPDGGEERWEDLKKTIDYKLRVSAGDRGPYEIELRLKKPNKYSTKGGTIPVLVHPDKPEKVKPQWKSLPKTTDVATGVVAEKLGGLPGEVAAATEAQQQSMGGSGPTDAGDPMATAREVMLQQYKLAKGPQKEMLAQQMRAIGIDPDE